MAIFERVAKLREPVTLELDGSPFEAERGEPIAVALLAASKLRLARSPKLHRPRGPSCLRGDCDGCIARLDGTPNVMLCLRAAQGGERVETQNVLGSRETDLLRVTDWFFPHGIDHHLLMAGIPGVHAVMQSFARKLAGIGKLPDEASAPMPAERKACDVLVVGAGLAGSTVAAAVSKTGLDVHLVDDGGEVGGSCRFAGDEARSLASAANLDNVATHLRATVAGIYDGQALVARTEGALVLSPKAIVLATGAHDSVVAATNNDLPGVMSARALSALRAYGVTPAAPLALIGDGFWIDRCATLFSKHVAVRMGTAELQTIEGSSRVKAVRDRAGKRTLASLIAVGGPGAPSFELAEMAGAQVAFSEVGYRVLCDPTGVAGPGVFAVGECTGTPFNPQTISLAATHTAAAVQAFLSQ